MEVKTFNNKVKKEPKLRYSEVFYSVQGEGRWVGVPSVFLRTFGCNFECAGFGQPRGNIIAKDDMPYMTDERANKEHPDAYKSIEELPVTPIGCDSSASWAMKYKHLQRTESVSEVIDNIISLLPNGTFQGRHGEDIHLVITGGEPLLGWQRVWPALLDMCREAGLINVTFETNTTFSRRLIYTHMSPLFLLVCADAKNPSSCNKRCSALGFSFKAWLKGFEPRPSQ